MTRRSEPGPAAHSPTVPAAGTRARGLRDMSSGPGHSATAWTVLAALATGCCATQPTAGEPPTVGQPPVQGGDGQPRPTLPGQPPEFAVIDLDEVRRRLWPDPGPEAYVAPDERQAAALSTLVRGMLADPPAPRDELSAAASAAGFEVQGWSVAGRRYLAAVEQETAAAGAEPTSCASTGRPRRPPARR